MSAPSLYRALLHFYPAAFREEYGGQMLLAFKQQLQESPAFYVWARAVLDLVTVAPKEHCNVILQDLRYALRTMAASRSFTAVAILSLALGIGANTAIFGLWNTVLHSSLPGVREPEQLVMLTNPNAAGVSIGMSQGERVLLTYAEFEQLRDGTSSFDGLMASQSDLGRWQARIDGGTSEPVQGRLVSGGYFQVLGLSPRLGRVFTADDDASNAPYAVLSYAFWQRRFGGSADVLGKPLAIRQATLTIIGVAPPNFMGETSGQNADLWVPLRQQPGVLPGRDWLHDRSAEKVMWLHVFGRLKSGVNVSQAQAQANAVFKAGLEAHYGAVLTPENRSGAVDQSLRVQLAPRGASRVRNGFSDPLTVLLIAVGVVLLIACANLANLLLARGTARRAEIALRLSLGASRGRLIRQLVTESLLLAAIGALAGLATAYVLHGRLVRMIASSDPSFEMAFRLEPRVLLFTLAVTLAGALLFGVLPAWQATRPAHRFKGRAPWGRLLVGMQLALSLPLLLGAGLLARTLYNLQHVDFGFSAEHLLLVRLDTQSAGYNEQRRLELFEDLRSKFQRLPGVAAASYSDNGVLSGRNSGDEIQVEGYTPKGDEDRGANWDMIGPGYFSTLGIPILLGREVTDADRAPAPQVCVINEAFAKVFFAGRNPIGMHITTIFGDNRRTHQIVGVAKDAHTQQLRGQVRPRYYAPLAQPLGDTDGTIFSIRTVSDSGPVIGAVRGTIQLADASVSIVSSLTLEDQLASRLAQDRTTATLAVVFGLVAIALAAIGLYGVLSYGVVRRQGEIAIRIALGARSSRVIGMILRETFLVILAGLLLGGGLAYAAARLIAAQLFGVAPQDPLTIGLSVALLLLVALIAAYLPAHRASRVDPMTALRRE